MTLGRGHRRINYTIRWNLDLDNDLTKNEVPVHRYQGKVGTRIRRWFGGVGTPGVFRGTFVDNETKYTPVRHYLGEVDGEDQRPRWTGIPGLDYACDGRFFCHGNVSVRDLERVTDDVGRENLGIDFDV